MSLQQHSAALDGLFQALGDPARRGMVDRLCRGPASVSELAEPLSMTLSAVVQHCKCSKRAASCARTNKVGCAPVSSKRPRSSRPSVGLAGRRSQWEARFDRLGEYLAGQDEPRRPTKKR